MKLNANLDSMLFIKKNEKTSKIHKSYSKYGQIPDSVLYIYLKLMNFVMFRHTIPAIKSTSMDSKITNFEFAPKYQGESWPRPTHFNLDEMFRKMFSITITSKNKYV